MIFEVPSNRKGHKINLHYHSSSSCPCLHSHHMSYSSSLKFFNFFKAHNSYKYTISSCCTLKSAYPKALAYEYLNNYRPLVIHMKETKR